MLCLGVALPVAHKSKPETVAAGLSETCCNCHNILLRNCDVGAHAAGACSNCYKKILESLQENANQSVTRNHGGKHAPRTVTQEADVQIAGFVFVCEGGVWGEQQAV